MIDDALTTIAFLVAFLAVLGAVEGLRTFWEHQDKKKREYQALCRLKESTRFDDHE